MEDFGTDIWGTWVFFTNMRFRGFLRSIWRILGFVKEHMEELGF